MTMRLSVSKETVPFTFTISSDFLDASSNEVTYFGDVKVVGKLNYIGDDYLAEGEIEFFEKYTCDRCLKETEKFNKFSFSEKFADYESDDAIFFADNEIDLTDTVRELILSSEPIQHLCKDDCKGLCKICGKDLNEGDCGCDRHIPDPRLSVLENLKL